VEQLTGCWRFKSEAQPCLPQGARHLSHRSKSTSQASASGTGRQAGPVGRVQQQEKEGAVSPVPSCEPAIFYTGHDGTSVDCADGPSPFTATLPQHHIKDWKLIRHSASATL